MNETDCRNTSEFDLFLLHNTHEDLFCATSKKSLHFESRGTIYSYFEIGLKPAVVSCLTNAIAPPPIALESCSRAQTMWPVFWSALKKNLLDGGCGFFVSDIISEVVFRPF